MDNNEFLSGGQRTPSVSWKNKPVGTTVKGAIAREPRTMQSLDYDDGTPEFWDPPANTQPKMQMAVYLDLGIHHPDTEKYPNQDGVWAWYVRQSTQAHKELKEAIRRVGAKGLEVGGYLTITYIGEGEQTNPKRFPPKHVRVEYQPPASKANDAFLAGPQPAAPAQYGNAATGHYGQAPAGAVPAGLDPSAWASLDDARRASVLAAMQAGPSTMRDEPPF